MEEFTWAQRSIWEAMKAAGRSIVIGGAVAVPGGTTAEQIAGILRFAMCRHQSLRTRVRFAQDGRPLQVVADSGEIPLYVVDARDDENPRRWPKRSARGRNWVRSITPTSGRCG